MKTFLKVFIGLLLAGGLFMFAFYRTPQERAFAKNLKLAQTGNMDAAMEVAKAYMDGIGTKPNSEQAIDWYKQAAAADKAQAAWELYRYYEKQRMLDAQPQNAQENIKEQQELALAYLQRAAQADFAPAQEELGNLYSQGKAMPQHAGQALFWYLKASQNGAVSAQAKVKAFATENPALLADMEQFFHVLELAQSGEQASMLEAAQAYRQGYPILQDQTQALEWYQKAWDKSAHTLSQAAFELADMYYKGEGIEQNDEKAADFLAQAAELKNTQAQYVLGEYAYTDNPARMEDAFAWFSNAAAQGHVKAQYMTGFMLFQGQGTAKSVPLAIRFFEQAAEQNDPSSQYVLGQIYLKGLGVRRSPRRGRAWLERAAENGSEPAKEMLGK